MRFPKCCFLLVLLAGCASTPSGSGGDGPTASGASTAAPSAPVAEKKAAATPREKGETGLLDVSVTDVGGRSLPARVELQDASGVVEDRYDAPQGKSQFQASLGGFRAFVYVYDNKVPILVHVEDVQISKEKTAAISVNLLEGASGKLGIRDFDLDGDLAIDRVELEAGTDPQNATSIPGRKPFIYDMKVLQDGERWYKGELNAVSTYGGGKETVAQLVQRAEQAGLDFLAITDLNTMEAFNDPAFKSDSVVLIPAMAWGDPDNGIALIYGPGTMPEPADSQELAQAECFRIQSQGGVFAIAHPCSAEAPWKWNIKAVNAVQVWHGPWRAPAPLRLASLPESIKTREAGTGELTRSVAAAAAVADKTSEIAANAKAKDLLISANDQGALFWDYETVRGSVCSVIAGSGTNDPKVPMGQPVTWIKAPNKSLPALMDGLRKGRTFVGNSPTGTRVEFRADSLNDGKVDVGMGGAVPLGVDVGFYMLVTSAAGCKVELLRNGHAIMRKIVEGDTFSASFTEKSEYKAVYRVRVIRQPESGAKGYGPVEVVALSSPIYADDIAGDLLMTGPVDLSKTWVRLDSQYTEDAKWLR
ncbi:MAG: hypothetical protein JNK74_25580 [Candidatus Hydrogenedentes bacterium]|nr:hypothetical protein [Candidatus Hydrogenedentota bacterium]